MVTFLIISSHLYFGKMRTELQCAKIEVKCSKIETSYSRNFRTIVERQSRSNGERGGQCGAPLGERAPGDVIPAKANESFLHIVIRHGSLDLSWFSEPASVKLTTEPTI